MRAFVIHHRAAPPSTIAARAHHVVHPASAEAFKQHFGADRRGTRSDFFHPLGLGPCTSSAKPEDGRQARSKRRVDMPITRALKVIFDAQTHEAKTILTRNGKRRDSVNFDHRWREAVVAAGWEELYFHDLRGTTCTMLAQPGATPSEIAAIPGWWASTVARMLDGYQSTTTSLSDSATAKLEAYDAKLQNAASADPNTEGRP